jgi:hypothetical protein
MRILIINVFHFGATRNRFGTTGSTFPSSNHLALPRVPLAPFARSGGKMLQIPLASQRLKDKSE